MNRPLYRFVATAFVGLFALGLAGCGLKIYKPEENQAVPSPATLQVTWNAPLRTEPPTILLDGTDVTSQFAISPYSMSGSVITPGSATATLSLTTGAHVLKASADVWNALSRQYNPQWETRNFTITPPPGDFSMTLQPTTVKVDSGQSASTTINIGRSGSFTGNVDISVSSLPSAVTSNAPLTIPAAQTSGSLTFNAGANANTTSKSVTVTGTGVVNNASKTHTGSLTLKVRRVRSVGPFSEITSSVVGQTSNRSCSAISVEVSSSPAYPTPLVALYARGGSTIGAPIGFHPNGTNVAGIGGAGFTTACDIGIVLDADASGYTSHAMSFSMLDLDSGDMFNKSPYGFNYTTPQGNANYGPRIFRSPDGTILLFLTAATISPAMLDAIFLDKLNQGDTIELVGIQPSEGSIGSAFSAEVIAGNKLRMRFGNTTYPDIDIP